ncbi:hypothetical protein GBA52_020545 [Prunus armeniaca]|nr:hypothetical protein GBA52_020545 [Prunus armeniaca]
MVRPNRTHDGGIESSTPTWRYKLSLRPWWDKVEMVKLSRAVKEPIWVRRGHWSEYKSNHSYFVCLLAAPIFRGERVGCATWWMAMQGGRVGRATWRFSMRGASVSYDVEIEHVRFSGRSCNVEIEHTRCLGRLRRGD